MPTAKENQEALALSNSQPALDNPPSDRSKKKPHTEPMVRRNIGFPAPVWRKFEQLCEKEGLETAPKVRSIIIQWVMQHDDTGENGATVPHPP